MSCPIFALDIDLDRVAIDKKNSNETVTVVIPTLNEEKTIENELKIIFTELVEKTAIVDEVIVVDGGSTDNTKEIVSKYNVRLISTDTLDYPKGKGLALWYSLNFVTSSIVVFVDADIENFGSHFVYKLILPFLYKSDAKFVKAFYERPLNYDNVITESGGGRVTELLVRPLFSRFYPKLKELIQPLSGEYAFKTEVAKNLLFYSNYGVETSLNIDFFKKYRNDIIYQVDLGVRVHRNRPIHELSEMSAIILQTFVDFAEKDNILCNKGENEITIITKDEVVYKEGKQVALPILSER